MNRKSCRHGLCLSAALSCMLAWACDGESRKTHAHQGHHEHGHGGHHAHGHGAASEQAGAAPPAPKVEPRVEPVPGPQIPDIALTDQNGKRHRFYTDLVKGKLVIMNAIFTSCGGSCPVQTQIFAGVARRLGDRVGKDVQMISVSLDPTIDTPERLGEFARRHGADPDWLFLTGPRPDVAKVLRAMDLYAADPRQHTPIAVIGNEPTGVWMKTINLTAPVEIVNKLEQVASLELDQVVD